MDALYFRIPNERQPAESQFGDLLEIAEGRDGARDWSLIRQLFMRCLIEESGRRLAGGQAALVRVVPEIADKFAQHLAYIEQDHAGKILSGYRPFFEKMILDAAEGKFTRWLVWKCRLLGGTCARWSTHCAS